MTGDDITKMQTEAAIYASAAAGQIPTAAMLQAEEFAKCRRKGKKRTVRAEGDPKYLIWGPHREESAMRDRQGHGLYLEYFPAWGSYVAKIFLETKLLKIIRYVGNVSEYFSRTTFDYGGIF